MNKKLQVNRLQISFRTNNGTVKAVRDISFDLYEGETLAIVGESGSGKSVTARAIMGILAPNAIIDGGQIIYDGKDLLSIREDEFHTLRGNKLSMIFQDPLSSLNPIVQIGRQLTEAMILNNKERRRSAAKRLQSTLKSLRSAMAATPGQDAGQANQLLNDFRSYAKAGIALETAYDSARLSAEQFVADAEGLLPLLKKSGFSPENRLLLQDLQQAAGKVYDPYLLPSDDPFYPAIKQRLDSFCKQVAGNTASADGATVIDEATARLKQALAQEKPDFFALGCLKQKGLPHQPQAGQGLQSAIQEHFEKGFLQHFLPMVSQALATSHQQAMDKRPAALTAIDQALAKLQHGMPGEGEMKALISKLTQQVEAALDPLDIQHSSPAYVMGDALKLASGRYYLGLKQNPKEEKRYQADQQKYERDVAKGRVALKTKPAALVDVEAAHAAVMDMLSRVKADFAAPQPALAGREHRLLDYLRLQLSERAQRVSKSAARFRAIKLMEEVGIPEPRKRFRQYPFQFSGGMRQRIVIAIALSANPDILICDEPTTALDVTIQAQILELINELREKRRLSVIFITHDLGVVANMADRIAVMYAGKIVEYGTVDDVFYEPKHPYTWALLASMPDLDTKEKLAAIPGTPPNMIIPPQGDAFAVRNRYAMQIDYEQQPPFFKVSDSHYAATWLLHPDAPPVSPPDIVTDRIQRMKSMKGAQP